MKTKTIEVNVYEVGDVIDISQCEGTSGKQALNRAKRGLVLEVTELKDGLNSYWVLTDEGNKVKIIPRQMRGENLIGNIDLSSLFSR